MTSCFLCLQVLGLTASVVNNDKRGESLEDRLLRLERLMRARLVTSVDNSIALVTGSRREIVVTYTPGGADACAGQRYWPMMEALVNGEKALAA